MPRLAAHEDDLPGTAGGVGEGLLELLDVRGCSPIPTGSTTSRSAGRGIRLTPTLDWFPVELEGLNRFGEPFQSQRGLSGANEKATPAAGQGPHQGVDDDAACPRSRGEASRLDHGVAVEVPLLLGHLTLADIPMRRPTGSGNEAVVTLRRLLGGDSGCQGGRGAREDHHDPVAEALQ